MRYDLGDLNRLHESDMSARTFVEYARCILTAERGQQLALLEQRVGVSRAEPYRKAAVAAISGATSAALMTQRLGSAFMGVLRRRTLLGQLAGTLPAFTGAQIPFVVTGATAHFVGELQPIPVAALGGDVLILSPSKLGLILVTAVEWLRVTDDRATSLLEAHLARAIREGEDEVLLSDDAAVAFERPAGLLFGLSSVGSGSPSDVADDLLELWRAVRSGEPDRPNFVASPLCAVYLSTLRADDGSRLFPDVSPISGAGTIMGVPLLTSKAAHANLILIDAASLAVSDDGVVLDASDASAIDMNDTPSSPANLVSMFQSNLRALRITRFINWQLGHADAVAFMTLPLGSPA